MREKLSPSIAYLRKLGPEHIEQVFDASRWIFEQNGEMAFEVCYYRSMHCRYLI